jgi:hypothetical protein
MEITIFKEITTEGVIKSIEENSAKYHKGFYANMDNLPERTLVKKSAADIGDIIKELKASRIKITKANTAAVNKEHDAIVARLEVANKPFTGLIDEYNVKRKKVLANEKRVVELRAAMLQKEEDHEMALLINKTFEYDKAEAIRINNEKQAILEAEAEKRVIARQKQLNEEAKQKAINAENARLANVEHVRGINREILSFMLGLGLDEVSSMDFIKALARKELPQLTINY